MEKKTKLKKVALGILTLGFLLLIYPMLNFGDAKRTNAQIIDSANIAKHNTSRDCWLIISGKVYNVTNFLSSHSGGASAITPYCGKDATAAFMGKPHPGNDLNALNAFYIGDVETAASQPRPLPDPSPILTKIIISSDAITLKTGETKLIKADAYDQNNKLMTGAVIIYSSSNENIGTIDASGSFHAKNTGLVFITASSGQARSTATVTVLENQISQPAIASSDLPKALASDFEKSSSTKTCETRENNDDKIVEEESGELDLDDGYDNDDEEEWSEMQNMQEFGNNYYTDEESED